MKATTKGKLGAIIGGVFGILFGIMNASIVSSQGAGNKDILITGFTCGLIATVVCSIMGFGYAFGYKLGMKWLGSAMGVAGTTSILAILFSKDRRTGFILSFLIFVFVLSGTIGVAYLPGIFMGIKQIKEEKMAS